MVGSDQKAETFYAAVNEYFEAVKPCYCPTQNVKSIERRVRKFLLKYFQFSSYVAKATTAQPSGSNSDDILQLETALLNKRNVLSVSDDCGPPFKHQSCWELLRDHPKFDVPPHPPSKPAESTQA